MNNADMKTLIKQAAKSNKILVVVGLIVEVPSPDYRFFIKTSPDVNYMRFNTRTLDDLCSNSAEIKKLINSDLPTFKKEMIILHKYKVRGGVPRSLQNIANNIEHSEKQKNVIKGTADEIYDKIMNIKQ